MKTNQPISNKLSWASKVILILLNLAKKTSKCWKNESRVFDWRCASDDIVDH